VSQKFFAKKMVQTYVTAKSSRQNIALMKTVALGPNAFLPMSA
jgi:hypothetical protein